MDTSLLVKLFGFNATLIHGDPLVLDRWLWLSDRIPATRNGDTLIDVGCGSGAFSIGAALRGYTSLGLSWDERNQSVAAERARICRAESASFEVQDVRRLGERVDLSAKFDVAISCENIEHILDDGKLMRDMAGCLKPGGRLLLTTPYLRYRPITPGDRGPFSRVEDGAHVRRGYSRAMIHELCEHAGLRVDEISFCSGILSQRANTLMRVLARIHPMAGWLGVLPFRLPAPILDPVVSPLMRWPYFSICVEAYKPRVFAAP